MKSRYLLRFALVLGGTLLFAFAATADQPSSPALRVVIIPSKTDIHIQEPFNVALRVENPTQSNQTVRVMSCSWQDEWQASTSKIALRGSVCTANAAVDFVIPPGGAYTNLAKMLVSNPIPNQTLFFRMGFTSIGGAQTLWSNPVKLRILPPVAAVVASAVDTNLTRQISTILLECQKIKPGMTRAELLNVFTTEGGLSTAEHRAFAHRLCPYIKVDVAFKLSTPGQKPIDEQPADTITRISKPYLEWSISD